MLVLGDRVALPFGLVAGRGAAGQLVCANRLHAYFDCEPVEIACRKEQKGSKASRGAAAANSSPAGTQTTKRTPHHPSQTLEFN